MEASDSTLTINIGGVRFKTFSSTLKTFPGTKLANLTESHAPSTYDFDPNLNEFFFDRNPSVFGYVMEYYRTGRLHFPSEICRSVFVEELEFWDINESHLARCCWLNLSSKDCDLEDFNIWAEKDQTDEEGFLTTNSTGRTDFSCRARWQPRIWALFKIPPSSASAVCMMLVSLLITIGAIMIFFSETRDQFIYEANVTRSTVTHLPNASSSIWVQLQLTRSSPLLFVELFCVVWFIVEFCLRFAFCPDKKKFMKSILNINDFISIFPVFIEFSAVGNHEVIAILWMVLGFMRISYIFRLLKFFMLFKDSLIIRVLLGSLRSIIKEILILMLVLAFETIFFSALMFYAEYYATNQYMFHELQFLDIYTAFWWAVVTLTTVGYGDVIPLTNFGKVAAALTAMAAILTIVIPIPILMVKFQHYYSIAIAHEKMKLSRNK
ncbi:voltage-gated potassium channel KCNC3-like [Lissotriton helveticus]